MNRQEEAMENLRRYYDPNALGYHLASLAADHTTMSGAEILNVPHARLAESTPSPQEVAEELALTRAVQVALLVADYNLSRLSQHLIRQALSGAVSLTGLDILTTAATLNGSSG